MKKLLSLVLCLTLVITVFASCGKNKGKVTMEDIMEDTGMVVGSISSDNGKGEKLDIYAYEILYLMNMDYTVEDAFDSVLQVKTLQLKAIENGIELDENAIADVDKQMDDYVEQFGSKEALEEQLSILGVTYDQFYQITKMSQQASMFQSRMVELGEFKEVTDDEAKKYFNDRFLKAKHILLSTMDTSTNEALPEEEQKAKKTKADEIVKAIRNGDDFEKYANLSEDPGSQSAPEGYVFAKITDLPDDNMEKQQLAQSGLAMVTEFEIGTLNINPGEVSDAVESQYGYHIIKRLELTDADYADTSELVKSIMNNQKFIKTVEDWSKSYKIEKKEDVLKAIDIEKFKKSIEEKQKDSAPAPTQQAPETQPEVVPEETQQAPAAE